MTITVCSGFSPSGYKQYGKKFLETFVKFWPIDINFVVYSEGKMLNIPRVECRNLCSCDGAVDFYERYKDDGRRSGKIPVTGWRAKDFNEGYAWRFDALKFYKQCIIPYDASKTLHQDDILVWLDADTVTFDHVPSDFIVKLIEGTDLIYLGRGQQHSEIGFWAVRICKLSRNMLQSLADMYIRDEFLQLREHHSAFVFDMVRRRAEGAGLRSRNLTPLGRNGRHAAHVWLDSPLAKYTDHLKGSRRKNLGHSMDHPIRWWER